MKIYPSKHDIIETQYDKINNADIPLACINIGNSDFNYYVEKEKSFTRDSETLIRPYDTLSTNDMNIYNESNEITTITLKENKTGNDYIYIPEGSKEFVPMAFSYKVLIKKEMKYASDNLYNLSMAAAGKESFLHSLMPLIGDAPTRNICPGNISVNGNDQQISSLEKESFENQDIYFIETADGINFVNNDKEINKIDIDGITDKNTNIWLCVDSFGKTMKDNKDSKGNKITSFCYNNNILYNNQNYDVKTEYLFDTDVENSDYPKSTYTYINLFSKECPVLLLQKKNNGFIIISSKSFLSVDNAKLIYEIMMYVVLNGYCSTEENFTWITDEPVDYLFGTEAFNRRHPNINLNDLLKNNRYDIDKFNIIDITTNNSNVVLNQINYNNDIFFTKVGNMTDPKKSENAISTYTTKNSVLIYSSTVIKKIETDLKIKIEITENAHYIIIGPCKSSSYKIDTITEQKLKIINYERPFYITFIGGNFMVVDYMQYDQEKNGVQIAYVKPIHKIDTVKYDTRISGGGLPEVNNLDDNYNLADISNRYGRPLRVGFAKIVRLPKKYKPYEDRIRKEIERHKASGEFIAVVFEDE